MKKILFTAVFIALTVSPSKALAFDYLKFTLGIGSGDLIHEVADQAVAEINDTPFRWKNGFGRRWIK